MIFQQGHSPSVNPEFNETGSALELQDSECLCPPCPCCLPSPQGSLIRSLPWLLPLQSAMLSPPHLTPSAHHTTIPSFLQNNFPPSPLPAFLCLSHSCFSNPLLSPTSPPPNSQLHQGPSPSHPPSVTVSCLSLLDCKPFSLPVLCDITHCLNKGYLTYQLPLLSLCSWCDVTRCVCKCLVCLSW